MADFVAVLKKTIGNLSEDTPEMRQKVYDKARTAIMAKLEAIDPPPSQAAVERQKQSLEDAIASVEGEYAATDEIVDDDASEEAERERAFAAVLDDMENTDRAEPAVAVPAESETDTQTGTPDPVPGSEAEFAEPDDPPATMNHEDGGGEDAAAPVLGDAGPANDAGPTDREEKPKRRSAPMGMGVAVAAAVIVVLLVGGAAAWWAGGGERVMAMFDGAVIDDTAGTEDAGTVEMASVESEEAADAPADAAGEENGGDAGPAEPAEGATAEAGDDQEKYTQRLMPDGSEVDEGPAAGERTIGEGTSVAESTPPEGTQEPAREAQEQAAGEGQQVPVGQSAVFYEERTNVAEGSAFSGSTVWSLVEESPGGDLPPEPAIRGEVTIPEKNINLRLTIRRNGDETLPASHIVELIFLTSENFEGGGISDVLRVALKPSEEEPGTSLSGIPVKIAEGYFLIALSDSTSEAQANMSLLRNRDWIDIPIVYGSGRRALVTMEKGVPGGKVFEEALQAWEAASSG